MTTRFLSCAAVVWLCLTSAAPLARAANILAPPPNVIFILADDLGWTDLGCYGSKYYETPNVDRLCAEGVKFTSAYTCGPNCQPTRAALMSGQYGPRTGIYTVGSTDRFDTSRRPLVPVPNAVQLAPETVTLAEMFKAAGYTTAMFGKWHLGEDEDHGPRAQGFDEALVTMGKHFKFKTQPPVDVPPDTYLADFLTDRALDFIERSYKNRDEGKAGPFFLYLPHFGVHSPHDAKPELIARFKDKPAVGGHHSPVYAAMIASLDESVGRIMKKLDELGAADDTIVIFTSDNGGVGGYGREGIGKAGDITDNAPLRGGKGMLYEGGVRVPFILHWPKERKPKVLDVPIITVDVYASFVEMLAYPLANWNEKPRNLDGGFVLCCDDEHDLDPNCQKFYERPLFWHFPGYLGAGADTWRTTPAGAIRKGDYKLIEFFEDGRLELYDLKNDLSQRHDLAAEKPELTKQLHAELVAWRERVGAPMPQRRSDYYIAPKP
ncbi:MAG TPA: sulfatase [Pirellulales bacterium]|nr:sulfatase [Pirellulales bacterium]